MAMFSYPYEAQQPMLGSQMVRYLLTTTKPVEWNVCGTVNGNEGVTPTLKFLELEPHHQMQFSVIPRTSLFGEGIFLFNKGYNQLTLNPTDRTEIRSQLLTKK